MPFVSEHGEADAGFSLTWAMYVAAAHLAMVVVDALVPLGVHMGTIQILAIALASRSGDVRLVFGSTMFGVVCVWLAYPITTDIAPRVEDVVVWNRVLSTAAVTCCGALLIKSPSLESLDALAMRMLDQSPDQSAFGQLEFIRKMMTAAKVGFIVADTDGQIVYANSVVARMLGYTPDELKMLHINALIPEELRETHDRSYHRLLVDGGDVTMRAVPAITKSGQQVTVQAARSRMRHDGLWWGVACIVPHSGDVADVASR